MNDTILLIRTQFRNW